MKEQPGHKNNKIQPKRVQINKWIRIKTVPDKRRKVADQKCQSQIANTRTPNTMPKACVIIVTTNTDVKLQVKQQSAHILIESTIARACA